MTDVSLLIVVAVSTEAAPLVRRWNLHHAQGERGIYLGQIHQRPVRLVITGMGGPRAAARAGQQIALAHPEEVAIVGLAGALSPQLTPGSLVVPETVTDAASGRSYHPTCLKLPSTGHLLSVDQPVENVQQKQRLRDLHLADAVDMESAAVARVCEERHIRWWCIRAISDDAHTPLPAGIDRTLQEDGSVNFVATVLHVLRHPWCLPALCRLGQHSRLATRNLAEAVGRILEDERQ